MRILKIEQCKSLSGGSLLTYHIGSNDEGDIYVRLYENSGGGLFSKQWIPLVAIEGLLEGNIASRTLRPLYEGKSINSPGFVLAVLLHEALVQAGVKGYLKNDSRPFWEAIGQLLASGVDLGTPAAPPEGLPEPQPDRPESQPEDRPEDRPESQPAAVPRDSRKKKGRK